MVKWVILQVVKYQYIANAKIVHAKAEIKKNIKKLNYGKKI